MAFNPKFTIASKINMALIMSFIRCKNIGHYGTTI
jgi:hypothetical protein